MSKEGNISEILINIDDYDIGEVIGVGGFGVVFKAKEKKTGEIVALKVILNTKILSKKKEQMNVIREITVPCKLNFPGVLKLKGFRFPLTTEEKKTAKLQKKTIINKDGKKIEVDMTGAIIVTEFIENGSLENIVKNYIDSKGKKCDLIDPTIRSKIIFNVAATMKKVHQRNVIHRDLKMQNIFLDCNKESKIADFGLAKVIMNKVDMTMTIGTPYIMAPEIFMDGDKTYGISVDVYAFAFFVYQMFSNTLQFADGKKIRSKEQFMMKIGHGQRPMRPNSIPDPYWDLVQRCWNQNPEARPTFEEITELLKEDHFAIDEYGMKTDLNQLHEYQKRVDKDDSDEINELAKSMTRNVQINDKTMLLKGKFLKSLTSFDVSKSSLPKITNRKIDFVWKRH